MVAAITSGLTGIGVPRRGEPSRRARGSRRRGGDSEPGAGLIAVVIQGVGEPVRLRSPPPRVATRRVANGVGMGRVGPVRVCPRLVRVRVARVVGAATVRSAVGPGMCRRDVVPFNPAIVEPPLKLTPGPPIALAAIHAGRLARPRSNERTAAAAT